MSALFIFEWVVFVNQSKFGFALSAYAALVGVGVCWYSVLTGACVGFKSCGEAAVWVFFCDGHRAFNLIVFCY